MRAPLRKASLLLGVTLAAAAVGGLALRDPDALGATPIPASIFFLQMECKSP